MELIRRIWETDPIGVVGLYATDVAMTVAMVTMITVTVLAIVDAIRD